MERSIWIEINWSEAEEFYWNKFRLNICSTKGEKYQSICFFFRIGKWLDVATNKNNIKYVQKKN